MLPFVVNEKQRLLRPDKHFFLTQKTMATLVRALSKKSVGLKQLTKIFQQQGGVDAIKLDLTEQKIGDDGLKQLLVLLNQKKQNKLKEIIFYGNDLSDNSIETLADLLTTHYRINQVRLDYNDITPVGAKKVADFLKTNETLHKLDLYGNKIMDYGMKVCVVTKLYRCWANCQGLGQEHQFAKFGFVWLWYW